MIAEVIRGLGLGGAETLLFNRLRYLSVVDPERLDATVVINTRADEAFYTKRLREIGVTVIELRARNPLQGMFELRRNLAKFPDAQIVFHSPVTSYLEKARRFFRRTDIAPLVEVVHSTQYRPLYRMAGWLLDRKADLALAVSDDVAAAATTAHFQSVKTVLAGVDLVRMRTWVRNHPGAPQEFRRRLGLDDRARLIVAVGSLIDLKGHRHAIEALSVTPLADVHLALVGDGVARDSLAQLAVKLGLADRVHFVGRVPDGWMWTAIADLLVHPSHFEGLPVALMEAAALGTPIVATDVGGVSEVLARGGRGILVRRPDAELLSKGLERMFDELASIDVAFAGRPQPRSYWSIDRYADEFYAAIDRCRDEVSGAP